MTQPVGRRDRPTAADAGGKKSSVLASVKGSRGPFEHFRWVAGDFDPDLKDGSEANHFAGYLLVPNPAAWSIVKSGMAIEIAQTTYGVSRQMLDWRLNMSGARRQEQHRRH